MNFEPIGKRISVQVDKQEPLTASGIALPGKKMEVTSMGTISHVGTDVKDVKLLPNVQVLFYSHAGVGVDTKDGSIKILEEKDILAIINQEEE